MDGPHPRWRSPWSSCDRRAASCSAAGAPPGSTPGGARLWLDRQPAATVEVAEGSFELAAAIRGDAGARLTVRVECAPVGARVRGADTRALAYVWVDLVVDAGAIGD